MEGKGSLLNWSSAPETYGGGREWTPSPKLSFDVPPPPTHTVARACIHKLNLKKEKRKTHYVGIRLQNVGEGDREMNMVKIHYVHV